jgi:hypothetical protein
MLCGVASRAAVHDVNRWIRVRCLGLASTQGPVIGRIAGADALHGLRHVRRRGIVL